MFGYGFGFVGMILYIMQAVAPGKFQTAHYALGSGVMQLGFIFSKTISGDIQLAMGYQQFFLWTIVCGVPALLLLFFVRIPQPRPAHAPDEAETLTAASATEGQAAPAAGR
jgi:PAT family beta-lactamase induction signal transducer AmpG